MEQQFEKAARLKLRFDTDHGTLTAEDLFDLPLSSLDTLAKELDREIKAQGEVQSFIKKSAPVDESLRLRFDLVLHVIKVRLEETEAEAERRKSVEFSRRVEAIIERKKDAELENKSIEELLALKG